MNHAPQALMRLGALATVLWLQMQAPGAAQAQSMAKFCEAEIQAQEAAQLTAQERSYLEFYKSFNQSESSRYSVGTKLVRSHLDDNRGGRQPDASPVSACLLKLLADESTHAETAAHAQEGYALRLLAGAGVPRNPGLAVAYLERAARRGYPSAGMHLAKLHLAEPGRAGSKAKAIHWLEAVAFVDEGKTVGGWSAGPDQPVDLLFDLLIADKQFKAAEALYRRARSHGYGKSMLAFHLKQIPGLKAQIEAEEAEAARLAEWRRMEAAERAMRTTTKTCITYKSGYKSCS